MSKSDPYMEMFQGRNSENQSTNKTEELVLRMLEPYYHTNRNVTMDHKNDKVLLFISTSTRSWKFHSKILNNKGDI